MSPAASPPDLQTLFEAAPRLYLVLDPELSIVAVRDAMAVQEYDRHKPDAESGGFEERNGSPFNSRTFAGDGAWADIDWLSGRKG